MPLSVIARYNKRVCKQLLQLRKELGAAPQLADAADAQRMVSEQCAICCCSVCIHAAVCLVELLAAF
jgi:hypothetical protein